MKRLVVDARMLTYSGIGTYLQNVLPVALPRLQAFAPVAIIRPEDAQGAGAVLAGAEQRVWDAAPLTAEEFRQPPQDLGECMWWAPHFNVPLRSSYPLVVTMHDLLPLRSGDLRHALRRAMLRAWLSAIRRRAISVLCASAATREDAISRGGLDPEPLHVVPLGVSDAWRQAFSDEDPKGDPYIVFVGLMKPHKNIGGLLRAFESIMQRIPHTLVLIARHQGLRETDPAALALARRLAPRVHVHDHVPAGELVRLVSGADLLVQPSFHEGFGLPPLEAMACGVPVVAARVAALEETGGNAAFYCDPHSTADIAAAILRVLGDAHLRRDMRERGRARAARFRWEACGLATADALTAAMTHVNGGAR